MQNLDFMRLFSDITKLNNDLSSDVFGQWFSINELREDIRNIRGEINHLEYQKNKQPEPIKVGDKYLHEIRQEEKDGRIRNPFRSILDNVTNKFVKGQERPCSVDYQEDVDYALPAIDYTYFLNQINDSGLDDRSRARLFIGYIFRWLYQNQPTRLDYSKDIQYRLAVKYPYAYMLSLSFKVAEFMGHKPTVDERFLLPFSYKTTEFVVDWLDNRFIKLEHEYKYNKDLHLVGYHEWGDDYRNIMERVVFAGEYDNEINNILYEKLLLSTMVLTCFGQKLSLMEGGLTLNHNRNTREEVLRYLGIIIGDNEG